MNNTTILCNVVPSSTCFILHVQIQGCQHLSYILIKITSQCININIDGAPIASHTHTDPTHSQNSLLLFTSLSFGTPFPRSTYCVTGLDVLHL
jgi:hypothetical protein